jgi:hypothetical protein
VQVAAAHLWGQSQAFKPHTAVELVEDRPSFASKRAFVLTLSTRRDDPKMAVWSDGIRRAHPDLDATAAWLETAA